uniref:Uncharacterized protein n=1 Tax=Lotharella oceanica TaxID=641309 RepID=A0A7S2TN95_9EUKA
MRALRLLSAALILGGCIRTSCGLKVLKDAQIRRPSNTSANRLRLHSLAAPLLTSPTNESIAMGIPEKEPPRALSPSSYTPPPTPPLVPSLLSVSLSPTSSPTQTTSPTSQVTQSTSASSSSSSSHRSNASTQTVLIVLLAIGGGLFLLAIIALTVVRCRTEVHYGSHPACTKISEIPTAAGMLVDKSRGDEAPIMDISFNRRGQTPPSGHHEPKKLARPALGTKSAQVHPMPP